MVLPYAPTFHSFHRHRLLLTRLIPNNLQTLANNTLNSPLKVCTYFNKIIKGKVLINGTYL